MNDIADAFTSFMIPPGGGGGGGEKWYGSEISIKQELPTIFYLKVVIYIRVKTKLSKQQDFRSKPTVRVWDQKSERGFVRACLR